MAVRRKSNWYIYLIAFAIALAFAVATIFAFKWYLFPEETSPVGLDKNGELTDDFRPSKEYNLNGVFMLSDAETDIPELFVMIAYNAVENRLVYIPFPASISMSSDERTLPNVYAAQGGEKVLEVLNDAIGVQFDFYVKMDRKAFISMVSSFGNLEYELFNTIIVHDGDVAQTINAGKQRLDAETIFRLIMKADFGEGESYRFNCIGTILSDLINQNFRVLDGNSQVMDSFYKLIADHSQNNITEELYRSHKAAFLNSAAYGNSPAEYYIPYGEYADDGSFVIAENSILTIRQKAGLE